jgi:hydrogenase-4 component E
MILFTTLRLLTIAVLGTAFLLVFNKRQLSYVKSFRMQSLFVAAILGVISIHNTIAARQFDFMLITFGLTFWLKVLFIPGLLNQLRAKVPYKVEKDFFVNIPLSVLICCGFFLISWYVGEHIQPLNSTDAKIYFATSLAVILIGLFFMVSRKKAIGQIIGFLTMENGIFVAAVLLTFGMPMIVELGVFFDLLTAVIIMGAFIYKIGDTFEHIDLNKLKNLKG